MSPTFYRVQHSSSFTDYGLNTGFHAKGRYYMRTDHIINAQRINSHLNWGARPTEPSPYISVFDNLDEEKAIQRARVLASKNRQNVEIMVIKPDADGWESAAFDMEFFMTDENRIVKIKLPYWRAESTGVGGDKSEAIFMSTPDLRQHLPNIDRVSSDKHEWLALHHIPSSMIKGVVSGWR